MSLLAACACGAEIEAPDNLSGQSVKCPQCEAALLIPSASGGNPADRAENYREDGPVPADLKNKTLAELGPNEQLVWIAQPAPALVFRRSVGYLVGGGGLALLALLMLTIGLVRQPVRSAAAPVVARQPGKNAAAQGKAAAQPQANAPAPAVSMGPIPLIVLLVGACCMVVPLYRWKMAQGSCYALTNRRALVWKQGLFGPTRESYSPMEVAAMRRSDSWVFPGGGDLIFRTVTVVSTTRRARGGSSSSVTTTHYGFLAITHVKEVEKLVRETLIDRFVDKLCAASAL